MRFSERLWRQPERDVGTKLAQLYIRSGRTSTTAAAVTASIQNDIEGRLIIATHIVAQFVPGAAQNLGGATLQLFPPNNAVPTPQVFIAFDGATYGANIAVGLRSECEVIIPPQWFAVANGSFNAGAAANAVTITVHGYTIPIGSLLPA